MESYKTKITQGINCSFKEKCINTRWAFNFGNKQQGLNIGKLIVIYVLRSSSAINSSSFASCISSPCSTPKLQDFNFVSAFSWSLVFIRSSFVVYDVNIFFLPLPTEEPSHTFHFLCHAAILSHTNNFWWHSKRRLKFLDSQSVHRRRAKTINSPESIEEDILKHWWFEKVIIGFGKEK